MIRQAVILAAGNGRRIKENTTDSQIKKTPKPLLNVGDKPIIDGAIRKLVQNGIDVCVVINPDHERIFRSKLKDHAITYCYQPKPLGTADALFRSRDFIKDDLFLVMMGDDIVGHDIKNILSMNEPTVFGFEVNDVTGYGVLVANRNDELERIIEKQRSGKGIVNTGVYIMPKKFFDIYDEIKINEKSGEYYLTEVPEILSRYGVKFRLRMLDKWFGVNTLTDLIQANER